ncbi:MAG: ribonucleoside-diphosphate reductase subunit alpha [Helicobacter sp.]|nr:ribonucleoside-diphosphate reductase subunit alpha [Helicobacter sp.]
MITVVKRNGKIEPLDIKKIQKYTRAAVDGLDNVSQSELEVSANLHFRDGISTEFIQQTLIKTAVDKIDIDTPNWTFVAARLFLYDLYHKVSGFTGYLHLSEYFKRLESEGKVVAGLKDKFDLEFLNSKIVPTRDLQFNYLGIKTLHDRYLIKSGSSKPLELPQHMFMAIAMFLAQNEADCNFWAVAFYDVLSKFEVMSATPTLANARTPRHQLSSCYIGSTPDNIEGIFDAYKEMALLSKYGGGIGWDFSLVRGLGSFIDGHRNAAGGIIPFLKITNDIAIAVDQLGTRKGAISSYIEIWHSDVHEFIDLRKNSGEERRRAHDLFPALWINDLFMKRLEEDGLWSLFDAYDANDLTNLYGADFEARYIELENDPSITKEQLKAKDLWKKVLTNYFESGLPFLCFKDNANVVNPNGHKGIIRSSNLCTEIFQNTAPNHYKIAVEFENDGSHCRSSAHSSGCECDSGEIIYFEENELVTTDNGITKKANKITALDSIGGKKVFIVTKVRQDGATAVCNLASINLSKINTKEDIARVVPIAVRMLDNVIDLNFYPNRKTKSTNLRSRSIGLGIMGEAQMLAKCGIYFGSDEHLNKIDEIMEAISFNAINASSDLAKEKGSYADFSGSNWSKGIFPIDLANKEAQKLTQKGLFDSDFSWDLLRENVRQNGMRNGYLMAIAPTSSISILVGTTQTIEPVYSRKWYEENLSGMIPVVVPDLNTETFNFYQSAYDLDQKLLVRAAAVRQKWIDQGQSLNIFMRLDGNASIKSLHEIYMLAWKLGIKSTYYLRTQSPEAKESVNINVIECESCQ